MDKVRAARSGSAPGGGFREPFVGSALGLIVGFSIIAATCSCDKLERAVAHEQVVTNTVVDLDEGDKRVFFVDGGAELDLSVSVFEGPPVDVCVMSMEHMLQLSEKNRYLACLMGLSSWSVRHLQGRGRLGPGTWLIELRLPKTSLIFTETSTVSVVALARR